MPPITKAMLRDYLSDALPEAEMGAVESALRSDVALIQILKEVHSELERGEHSIGAIWRRERLSCPSRDLIGSYLLKALDDDVYDYIAFHLQTIGCPACQANYDDLSRKQAEASAPRRAKILHSSQHALKKARQ